MQSVAAPLIESGAKRGAHYGVAGAWSAKNQIDLRAHVCSRVQNEIEELPNAWVHGASRIDRTGAYGASDSRHVP
jgi:hypothetical protein